MPKNRPPIKWQEPGAKHRRNQQAVVKMMAQAPICHCEGALRPWQSRSTRPNCGKAIGENAENSCSDQSEACGEEKSGRVIITLFKQKRVNYP